MLFFFVKLFSFAELMLASRAVVEKHFSWWRHNALFKFNSGGAGDAADGWQFKKSRFFFNDTVNRGLNKST